MAATSVVLIMGPPCIVTPWTTETSPIKTLVFFIPTNARQLHSSTKRVPLQKLSSLGEISPEDRTGRKFEEEVDNNASRRGADTQLGLSIVSRVDKLHGTDGQLF